MHIKTSSKVDRQRLLISQIIINCVKPGFDLSLRSQLKLDLSELSDWEDLFERATEQKVLCQLYSKLTSLSANESLDRSFIEKLKRHTSHQKKRSLLYAYELKKITEALEQSGISAISFKGPTLSQTAYGDLYSRSFIDLDLLLDSQNYLRVREVLAPLGYEMLKSLQTSQKNEQDFLLYAGEYTLIKEKNHIFVDVHNHCLGGASFCGFSDFSVLWDRLESVEIAGKLILTFSKEDLLIYLCLNALKDGWSSLRQICDITELVQNNPSLNWKKVKLYSRELKVEKALELSLLVAEKLLGLRLPKQNVFILQHRESLGKIAQLICLKTTLTLQHGGSALSYQDEFWIRWQVFSTLPERRRYCISIFERFFKLLFAVNNKDVELLKLPSQLNFLYYFIRPWRGILLYRQEIFRSLIK